MAETAKREPNGKWRIQYRYTDWTGAKHKTQKRGFKTKKEAETWLSHFHVENAGDPTMTFEDFYEIYKKDMEKRLKPTTMQQKEYMVRDKLMPYFGKIAINEITAVKVRMWQGKMLKMGFKPTYLKTLNNQLSAMMNYAVKFYDLKNNPCHIAGSIGKSQADERPFWTLEQFNMFLASVDDKQDSWVAFQILFWTGIRIGELLALKVNDFDFEKGTMRIDENLQKLVGQKAIIQAPKTDASIRTITLDADLTEIVQEYISSLYKPKATTRLFETRTKSFFEHEMQRGIKAAGLPEISLHCLRHSHAMMLVELGFTPQVIAKRLGHGKVVTTIEIYCNHLPTGAQEKVANELQKVKEGNLHGVSEQSS